MSSDVKLRELLADASSDDLIWFRDQMSERSRACALNSIEETQVQTAREQLTIVESVIAERKGEQHGK